MTLPSIAKIVSAVLIIGIVSTSAVLAADRYKTILAQTMQTKGAPTNSSPLPPGRAAGIKVAQGYEYYWIDALLAVAAVVAIVLLLVDDDDESSTTTAGN
jgi:hypothetical protein